MRWTCALLATAAMPVSLSAHHSLAQWDTNELVELEGVIREIVWRNPHSQMRFEVTNETGAPSNWELESGSITELRLAGASTDLISVGARVMIAGYLSKRGGDVMFARNMLLPDGEEILLAVGSKPHWSDVSRSELLGTRLAGVDGGVEDVSTIDLFRVWSTVAEDPEAFPMVKGQYPLTGEAESIRAQFDASTNPFTAFDGCDPKGMPLIMSSPFPMEFVRANGDILLRIEEYDSERVIHMSQNTAASQPEYSLLGYSAGRWEGTALVVETTHIESGWFDGAGAPQSRNLRLLERFELGEGGQRLDYTLTVTDPETFTEPFNLTRYWVWEPGAILEPWNCGAVR